MNDNSKEKEIRRKRTIADKLISGFNEIRFSVSEPRMLKKMRILHEKEYETPEDEPLISVYTPTYNRGNIIVNRALPSVLDQTYKNFEYVIIGDHCTDDTEELIKKYDDPRIRFYNIPHRGYRYPETAENHWLAGPVIAANTGLSMVKGKWIARIDDDEIWTENRLAETLQAAQEGNYEFVSAQNVEERRGKRYVIDGIKANDPYYTNKPMPQDDDSPKVGGTSTWLYRSYLKVFKYNINCWRKKWNRVNDVELSVRMFKAGVRMGFIEKVLLYTVPRPGELTVGLEAYREQADEKMQHYKFDK